MPTEGGYAQTLQGQARGCSITNGAHSAHGTHSGKAYTTRSVARCYVAAYEPGSSGGGGLAGRAASIGKPGPKSDPQTYRKKAQVNSYAAAKATSNTAALKSRMSAPATTSSSTTHTPARAAPVMASSQGYYQKAQAKAKQLTKTSLVEAPKQDACVVPRSVSSDAPARAGSGIDVQPDWEQMLPWERLAAESSGNSSVYLGIDTTAIASPQRAGYASRHPHHLTPEQEPLLSPCNWSPMGASVSSGNLQIVNSDPCQHLESPRNSIASSSCPDAQRGEVFGADSSCSCSASDAGTSATYTEHTCLSPSEVQPLLDAARSHLSAHSGPNPCLSAQLTRHGNINVAPSPEQPLPGMALQHKQEQTPACRVSVVDMELLELPVAASPALQPASPVLLLLDNAAQPAAAQLQAGGCCSPAALPPRPSPVALSPKTLIGAQASGTRSPMDAVSVPTSMGGSKSAGLSSSGSCRGAASVSTSWGGSRSVKPIVFDEDNLIVPTESDDDDDGDDDQDEELHVGQRVPSTASDLRAEISTLTAAWQEDVKEKMFLKQAVAAGEANFAQLKHQATAETEVAKLRMRIAEEGERAALSKLQAAQARISQLATELNVAKRQITSLEDEVHRLTTKLHLATHETKRLHGGSTGSTNPHTFQFFNSMFNAPTVQSGSPRSLADTLNEISLMPEGATSPKADPPKSPLNRSHGPFSSLGSCSTPSRLLDPAEVAMLHEEEEAAAKQSKSAAGLLSSVKGAVGVIAKQSRALSSKTLKSFKKRAGSSETTSPNHSSSAPDEVSVCDGIGRSPASAAGFEELAATGVDTPEAAGRQEAGTKWSGWALPLKHLCGVHHKQAAA